MFIYDKLLRQPLKFLQYCISFIFPKNKKIIVYGAWYGKNFTDNSKYVYLEASKDKDFKNIWISRDKSIVAKLKSEGYRAEYIFSVKGIFYQLIAGKAVVCVGYIDLCRPLIAHKKVLNLWHGVPLKKIMYDVSKPGLLERIQDAFFKDTRVLYTSPNFHEIYKRCFGKDDAHLLLCGQPRNDIFYNENLIDSVALKQLEDLIKNRKFILYLPTHRSEGKVDLDLNHHIDFKKLNDYCKKHNIIFVLKRHFYHLSEQLIEGYSNIADISKLNFDAQFLMSQADMLITDYSSCYIDYLLRDKPIIFFQYDKSNYIQNERELYFDNDLVQPGPIVQVYNELELAIDNMINGNFPEYESKRIESKNFFYDPSYQKEVSALVWDYVKSM